MILYFENHYKGTRREIGRPETVDDIYPIIKEFLDNHNFTSYYTRTWISSINPKEKIYDVGSHTEFFVCYNEEGWE